MKIFIKNRKDQKVCVVIDEIKNPKGLAFIIHGLGSNKDRPSITESLKCLMNAIIMLSDLIQQIRSVKAMVQ